MPDSACPDALSFNLVSGQADEEAANGGLSDAETVLLEYLRDSLCPSGPTSSKNNAPYIFDHGHFRALHFDRLHLQSEMDLRDPVRLTIDYTRIMMGFLFFVDNPRRIEMIGLGGGSLAKYCYERLPDSDITAIEISPEVIGLRDRFLIPPDGDRFRVVQGDGADFVRCDAARPDIILVDGFDPSGQPPQLCSPEFYRDCYRRLTPGGLMVVNLWGSYQDRVAYTAAIQDAFNEDTLLVPTQGGTNYAVFAGKAMKPTLSRTGLAHMMSAIGHLHGPFLGIVGRRIARCVERIQRRRETLRPIADRSTDRL